MLKLFNQHVDWKSFKSVIYFLVFNSYTYGSLVYILLLLISSINVFFTSLINVVTLAYAMSLWIRKKKKKLKIFLLVISIGNFLTFETMVVADAEVLFWEHILHVLFYFIGYSYFICSTLNVREINQLSIIDLKHNIYNKNKP